MGRTIFNKAQLHILRVMSYIKSDEELQALKKVISEYYARRVDEEAERLWKEGVLSQDKLDEILKEHLRTPYKE